jgi:hypothetical protein
MGYSIMFICTFNLLINLGMTIYSSMSTFIGTAKTKYEDHWVQSAICEQMHKHKNILSESGNHIKGSDNIFEAIAYCKDWKQHVKWLRLNNIDYSEFDEEKTFR